MSKKSGILDEKRAKLTSKEPISRMPKGTSTQFLNSENKNTHPRPEKPSKNIGQNRILRPDILTKKPPHLSEKNDLHLTPECIENNRVKLSLSLFRDPEKQQRFGGRINGGAFLP